MIPVYEKVTGKIIGYWNIQDLLIETNMKQIPEDHVHRYTQDNGEFTCKCGDRK